MFGSGWNMPCTVTCDMYLHAIGKYIWLRSGWNIPQILVDLSFRSSWNMPRHLGIWSVCITRIKVVEICHMWSYKIWMLQNHAMNGKWLKHATHHDHMYCGSGWHMILISICWEKWLEHSTDTYMCRKWLKYANVFVHGLHGIINNNNKNKNKNKKNKNSNSNNINTYIIYIY